VRVSRNSALIVGKWRPRCVSCAVSPGKYSALLCLGNQKD
jgi:hypothetical protein